VTEAATAPPPAPASPPRWGLGDAAVGWVAAQLFTQVWALVVLVAAGRVDDDFDDLPLSLVALAQAGLALAFFAVPYIVSRAKGNGLVSDFGLRARWEDVWKGGVPGVVAQIVVLPLLYWPLLELLDKSTKDLEGPARSLSDRVDGAAGAVLLILIVGVLAPVFEELFYRGLVQRALLKRGLPPVLAIGITALFFGATHFQLLQLPGLVLAGALFGTLAYRFDRLGPAIAAHVTFNMVTVVALLAS
jgi:membrane protease YdiL (CAAX protease family)